MIDVKVVYQCFGNRQYNPTDLLSYPTPTMNTVIFNRFDTFSFFSVNNFENYDCVEISLNAMNVWQWDDKECTENYRYVCELPRVSMNIFLYLQKNGK